MRCELAGDDTASLVRPYLKISINLFPLILLSPHFLVINESPVVEKSLNVDTFSSIRLPHQYSAVSCNLSRTMLHTKEYSDLLCSW